MMDLLCARFRHTAFGLRYGIESFQAAAWTLDFLPIVKGKERAGPVTPPNAR